MKAILASIDVRDVFVFSGLGLLAFGAGLIYMPAAFVVAGLALLLMGIFGIPQWH